MVPIGRPGESLTQAQAGMDIASRGIPIPCDAVQGSQIAGIGYGYECHLDSPKPFPVLSGYTIRGMFSCQPGTATPGPGALSNCVITAVVEVVKGN